MKRWTMLALVLVVAAAAFAMAQGRPRPPGGRRYSIEQATSDRAQLNTIAYDGLAFLTGSFCARITGIVSWQRPLLAEIVSVRREIATELRRFMAGDAPDRSRVVALARRYGELDGDLSYQYAARFVEVARALDADQGAQLMRLRDLDGFECRGAHLYSEPIAAPSTIDDEVLFSRR